MSEESASALLDQGRALRLQGQFAEALECFETALELDATSARAHAGYAVTLSKLGQTARAIESYWESLRWNPENARVYSALGHIYLAQARAELAVDCYRRSLALDPDDEYTRSSLLYSLNYDVRAKPEEVYREHREFGERFGVADCAGPHRNTRSLARRLRIGYTSGDFFEHSVAYFFEPILEHHSRENFEITLYSNTASPDAVTERMQGLAGCWRPVNRVSDEAMAQMVIDDRIDILVDLSGHTAGTRLRVFARKPAPIQVSYIGYPNTTGFSAIDYRITDACADPPGSADQCHSEELLRLPRGFLAYYPPRGMGNVAEPPVSKHGAISFGSSSKPHKWNLKVIETWAAILRRVPDSRLLLHHSSIGKGEGGALVKDELRTRVVEQFFAFGILPDRIETHGALDWRGHRDWFGRVDLALDPFPYNGTTATCETLWMGVPVIALAGYAHVGRVGVSLLNSIGLGDLIAADTTEYVELAVELASDTGRLAELRAGMRDQMRGSALMDAAGLTRALEDAYRSIWRRWVEANGGESA